MTDPSNPPGAMPGPGAAARRAAPKASRPATGDPSAAPRRRRPARFAPTLAIVLGLAYFYAASRIASGLAGHLALALPFVLVWIVPAVYWNRDREYGGRLHEFVHGASYVSMGWLNFALLLVIARDLLLVATGPSMLDISELRDPLAAHGAAIVVGGSVAMLGIGVLAALGGPRLRRVRIEIDGLDPGLAGFTIAQISDLHVGPTIGERYVRRVVERCNRLAPDLVALTGDFVDGPVARLAGDVAPLAALRARHGVFFAMGNHDYYAGAHEWIPQFRALGFDVLLNAHRTIRHGGAAIVVGGVVDPAVRLVDPRATPRPDLAMAPDAGSALRILLAHNPQLAPLAARAGFDLQLSGHTHAGQFFPWTLVVRRIHAPHVVGLSREGKMKVYVNPGTGSWGPPVRFGTSPELTLITLAPAPETAAG